ncbi:hypothetical protein ACHAAC_16185 [Aeromicrobium sp. CF4.19]|uniref:hypothetical protein n=1 Tax=Aeromicrobium sp. CF4.19 TaxID=3373082 RepID=UPI003EE4AB4C
MLRRAGLTLLGLVTGILGAVVHRHAHDLGGVDVPWGLVLALAATTAVAWAGAGLVRAGAAWFGLGWTLMVLLQQSASPGSYLVAGDVLGWTFLVLGLGGIALVVAMHPGPPGTRRRGSSRRSADVGARTPPN